MFSADASLVSSVTRSEEAGGNLEAESKTEGKMSQPQHRVRVYDLNPHFLQERQARAEARFKQREKVMHDLEEFMAEQEE